MSEKINYKETLNLPRTAFPMKANLAQREPQMLKRWAEIGLHRKMVEKNRGKPRFTLHDGPPYANGDIHLGHALNKVLKDVIVRYKIMKGFFSNYVPGWDCHGLPIEQKVTSELGTSSREKSTIEIRRLCYDYAMKYVNIQREQFKRLGVDGDWDNPYLTLSPEYEVGILSAFRELVKGGYIYRGLKPVHWCYSCLTALAEAEVEYKPHISPSVYVRFPLLDKEKSEILRDLPDVSVVIWTTTPWTLPANLAVCLHPEFDYVAVIGTAPDKETPETFIVAEGLLNSFVSECNIKVEKIASKFKGKDLEKLHVSHPLLDRDSLIIVGDLVTLEQGTGCVHIAPGHGMEDYIIGQKYGLPIIVPVDNEGKFTEEYAPMKGVLVWDANDEIIKVLRERKLLVHSARLEHSYPHCWRCHNPILFRATEQWFMNVEHRNLRQRALQEIDNVKWIPRWGRERIYSMMEIRPDWCLSRQRCWGVPLPVVHCNKCHKSILDVTVIDSFINVVAEKGTDAWYTEPLEILIPAGFKCPECGSQDVSRETDILDVWFDSGASHIAVVEKHPDMDSPADMYLEGSDQHRGWFQSSLLVSMGARGRAPYKTVLTHGFILDEHGEAMSKSKGNVISPEEIINKFGADVLRLWVVSEDYRNDVKVSFEILERIAEAYRRIRNTLRFLLGNLSDFNPEEHTIDYKELMEFDRWALHQLFVLIKEVERAYERFEFHKIFHLVHKFCIVEMSSIYLDVLKDRLYCSGANQVERRSAQTTLFAIASALIRLIAPILVFTADESWQHLFPNDESVHLTDFPTPPAEWFDEELNKRWEKLLEVREVVLTALEGARRQRRIGHSLDASVNIITPNKKWFELLQSYKLSLPDFFIVSAVEITLTSAEKIPKREESAEEKSLPLYVEVSPAPGKKCERCWRFDIKVGSDTEFPSLCERCSNVLRRS